MHYDAQRGSVVERIEEAAMSLLPFARRKVRMQIDGGVEAEKPNRLLESMSIRQALESRAPASSHTYDSLALSTTSVLDTVPFSVASRMALC